MSHCNRFFFCRKRANSWEKVNSTKNFSLPFFCLSKFISQSQQRLKQHLEISRGNSWKNYQEIKFCRGINYAKDIFATSRFADWRGSWVLTKKTWISYKNSKTSTDFQVINTSTQQIRTEVSANFNRKAILMHQKLYFYYCLIICPCS